MTAIAGRQTVSAGWQTWVVLAVTVAVGRWIAGPTFGYTLFALTWGPIAALWIFADDMPRWRPFAEAAVTAGLFALPWAFDLSTRSALMASGLQGLLTVAVVSAMTVCRHFSGGQAIFRTVIGLGWLAWLVLPLTMATQLQTTIGEVGLDRLLAIHPVLLMNTAIDSAGDWTHQNLAYVQLTRLGQDVPFDWPASFWPAIATYGSVIGVAAIRQLFHVEQLPVT